MLHVMRRRASRPHNQHRSPRVRTLGRICMRAHRTCMGCIGAAWMSTWTRVAKHQAIGPHPLHSPDSDGHGQAVLQRCLLAWPALPALWRDSRWPGGILPFSLRRCYIPQCRCGPAVLQRPCGLSRACSGPHRTRTLPSLLPSAVPCVRYIRVCGGGGTEPPSGLYNLTPYLQRQ